MTQPSDFNDFIEWFTARHLRRRAVPVSPATIRTKKIYLSMAANLVGADTPSVLCELLSDRDSIEHLLDEASATLSPASVRQMLYALKPFAEYGRLKKWVTGCALLPTDFPAEGPGKAITIYTPEEMDLFVSASRGHSLRFWAFIGFLADTGRRVGEALKLEWALYRPEATPPYFDLHRTKNGTQQYVPLGKRLREEVFTPPHVEQLKAAEKGRYKMFKRDPKLFPFPWEYSTVHGIFGRFCEDIGVPNRGFHCFRHTVITNRIAAGVPIQAVSALAGHANTGITTKIYNHATALDYAKFID